MKRHLLAFALAVGLGCAGDPGPSPPAAPPPPPPPPPAPNTVTVGSNFFSPQELSASRNTTVTWTFQAGPHNVTFEDGQGNSGDQSAGTHNRTFGTAGTFRYRCTIHSTSFANGMIGQVVISN